MSVMGGSQNQINQRVIKLNPMMVIKKNSAAMPLTAWDTYHSSAYNDRQIVKRWITTSKDSQDSKDAFQKLIS